MTTLLQAQKTLNADPVVNLTVGSTNLDAYIARYKYQEKHGASARSALWLDNAGGVFNDLAGDWPGIERGAEAVITRGLLVGGSELTAALPMVWVESLMYVYQKQQPYLVLDCIDWVKRLQYFRYETVQTWTGELVEAIVADILGEVGLTLTAGAWSTALSIDYTVSVSRSGWSALQDLMSKVPEELYAKPGKEIGWKTLDASEAAGYDYGYNTTVTHPLLDKSGEAEASPRYNWVKIRSDTDETFSGIAYEADEVALVGYRRRTVTDRTLTSDPECLARAAAELEVWLAKSTAGVIVARPHFTVRLFDCLSAPAPLWGGRAIGSGHVTRIIEWFNYANRPYEQALTIGELPDAAVLLLGDDEEETLPVDPEDPTEPPQTPPEVDPSPVEEDDLEDGSVTTGKLAALAVTTAKIAALAVTTAKLDADAVTSAKIADNAIGNEHMQNDSITAAEIAALAVDTSELAADAVTGAKLADNAVGNEHLQNDAVGTDEIANSAVTQAKIADNAVGSGEIIADAVTGAKIADDAVDSEHIADGAVDPGHLAAFPKCRVYRATTVQTIQQATTEAVQWNAESYDVGGLHSTVTNPSRVTVATAGYYEIHAHVYLDLMGGGDGAQAEVWIRVDGATAWGETRCGWVIAATENVFEVSDQIYLGAGSYFEIMVENTDAVNDIQVEIGEGLSYCWCRLVS